MIAPLDQGQHRVVAALDGGRRQVHGRRRLPDAALDVRDHDVRHSGDIVRDRPRGTRRLSSWPRPARPSPPRRRRDYGSSGNPCRGHGQGRRETSPLCAGLFGWEIEADNPLDYGLVERETNFEGVGIGGGIGGLQGGIPDRRTIVGLLRARARSVRRC